jgi:hypothetical protein
MPIGFTGSTCLERVDHDQLRTFVLCLGDERPVMQVGADRVAGPARQSFQRLGESMEGTLAISLVGRDSTTESKWANLSKRAVPVGQQNERILHRGLRSLLHPLWA